MVLRRTERYGLVVALLAFMLLSLAAPAGAVTYSQEPSISTSLQPTDIAYLPSGPGFVVRDSISNKAVNISMTGAIRSTSPALANARIAYNSHGGNIYLSGRGPGGDELDIFDTNFVPQYTTPYSIAAPQTLGAYYDPGIDTDVAVLGYLGMVQKISANTGTIVGSFTGPTNPVAIACAPDITTTSAQLAYILTSSAISIYDIDSGNFRATPVSGLSSANAIAVESTGPHHLLFVGDVNQVKMFSPSTSVQDQYSAAGTITLPANVRGIAVDDSEKLYVTTQGSSAIAVYSLRPGITGIDPHSGPTAGGTVVTITGYGFQNADSSDLSVYFGSTPATGFVVDSDTQITAVAPAGTAGTVYVSINSPYGTSRLDPDTDAYTYVAPPTVTSVSPAAGPASGGTSIVITGTGFTSGATVTCGGSSATGVNVVSENTITATTPAHAAGAVDVVVTSLGGTSATSSSDLFTYAPVPTVSGITPTSGSTGGATTVIITGTGFTPATAVTFGSTAATGFTVNSPTTITATSPAGTGTVDVRVTSPGGTSDTVPADQFTYITPCSPAVALTTGGSLAAAVSSVCDGGTITVGPGTYRDYGIAVGKSVTIRAADGSGPADITIDGMQGGSSILTIASGHMVVLDNLTFFNATGTDGGAVNNNGNLVVNSSAFRNCTAPDGGAIYSTGTIGGIALSDFSNNTVVSSGGGSHGGSAIWSSGTITGISSSTFSDGTAIGGGLYGAAIYNSGSIGTISSSTFSGGRTDGGGGAIYTSGSIGTISSSTFSGNLAQLGGAILNGGTIGSLSGSTFNGGLAIAGGAILNGGTITAITSTDFNGCRADSAGAGGAIDNRGSIALISSTTFTGCSCGNYGGAIYNNAGGMITSIVSSTFTGSEAREGGAIYSTGTAGSPSGVTLHFCRLVNNTGWDAGDAVFSGSYSTVLAENNWWGNNSPDFAALAEGSVSYSPWLVLNASAAPSSVTTIQTSTVLMKLTSNSAGDDTIVSGNVPDGIPVAYSLRGVTGNLAPEQGNLTIGTNSTVLDPSSAGTATITVTVDGESVAVPVVVSDVPTTVPTTSPTTAPTTIPTTLPTTPPTTVPTTVPVTATTTAVFATRSPDNDDGFPSVTPTASQADTLPLMTVTVNIGGDSKAWQAVVTGTGLRDLIVTGTIQPGSGSNVTAPPGTVFQYLSLVPARFTSITKAVLHFTVPQSWLDENHIAPKSVVLYHLTANGWEALPTTVLYTKDGTVYFSGESAGFSLFAIAGMPTVLTPPGIAATQEIVSTPAPREPPETIVKAPVTSRTTAPPAAAPQPAAPSPLLNIVLVIAAIGVLAGGGFLVRCWWIRRQNPTLFREYD